MTEVDMSGMSAPVSDSGNAPASGDNIQSQAPAQPAYKTLPVDQINSITRDAHHRGYLKGKEEAASAHQPTQQPVQQAHASQIGMSPEEIRKMVAEESARQIQNTQAQYSAQAVLSQFQQKMGAGAAKYQDFNAKMGQLNFGNMADIVQMTAGMENTADIMYDLASNPYKIAQLQQLAQTQPSLAYSEMQKLSNSIRTNQAPAVPVGNPPLSQIASSPIGTSGDSIPDIEYFKTKYRG